MDEIIAQMQAFSDEVEAIGLSNIHAVKHIIHVRELLEIYEVESFGKKTEPVLNELIRF